MKLFFLYIKGRAKILVLALLFITVFAVVTLMYGYPPEPVLYASCICIYLGAMLCVLGFLRFRRRHGVMKKLMESITVNTESLPVPRDVLETDYTELIRQLVQQYNQLEMEISSVRREHEDYYTMWAHQIKTPIAAMRLFMQTKGEEQYRALLSELFKIEEYVGMALSYMRSESMTSDLLLRRLPLDDIIKQAVRKYAGIFIAEKIKLTYEDTGVQVVTDAKWLLFILEQILSNALKYTKKGSISIYMDAAAPKTLVIEDTGIGIRAEDLPRVFERGYTGYNGREYTRATGIGLYLCLKIATKLGHTIKIESKLGEGTRVLLDLQEYAYQDYN